MFDAIALSNGWDDVTAALQLRSHLQNCDVMIVVMKEAEELPTSEVTEDTSPGIPTLGTAEQSLGYMVFVEATLGASWVPDCTPAFPAPALRKGSQPRLTAWPLLCPRPSMLAPPVVGAGLAEDTTRTRLLWKRRRDPLLL